MVRQLSLVLALALSAAVVLTSIGASHPGSDTDACQHSNNGHAPGMGHGICTLERGGPAQQGPTPVDTPHTHLRAAVFGHHPYGAKPAVWVAARRSTFRLVCRSAASSAPESPTIPSSAACLITNHRSHSRTCLLSAALFIVRSVSEPMIRPGYASTRGSACNLKEYYAVPTSAPRRP